MILLRWKARKSLATCSQNSNTKMLSRTTHICRKSTDALDTVHKADFIVNVYIISSKQKSYYGIHFGAHMFRQSKDTHCSLNTGANQKRATIDGIKDYAS